MMSLARKLQETIVRHVKQASPEDLARLVGTLAANGAAPAAHPVADGQVAQRFTKIGADGREVLDAHDGEHVAVHDATAGLTWSRSNIGKGRMNWKDADEACRALDLAGGKGWRLPTVQELLALVDYERQEPAIDAALFDCESAWYWTSTPAAASPADCAWLVYFYDGGSGWGDRGGAYFARAVRPGQ